MSDAPTLVKLLRSKNRCLERLLDLSDDCAAELGLGRFEGIPGFEVRRAEILKAYELFERKVTEEAARLNRETVEVGMLEQVEACLARKQELIRFILLADQKIILAIEAEKTRLENELQNAGRDQTKMSKLAKFKSSWVPENGEGLDEKL